MQLFDGARFLTDVFKAATRMRASIDRLIA
jgi:hypothetical protein